jgi:hypothetical protein
LERSRCPAGAGCGFDRNLVWGFREPASTVARRSTATVEGTGARARAGYLRRFDGYLFRGRAREGVEMPCGGHRLTAAVTGRFGMMIGIEDLPR